MEQSKGLHWTALVLVVVGAINWGLVGAFHYNLVDKIFGVDSAISRIIYVLVGVAGLVLLAYYVAAQQKQGVDAVRH